MDKYFIEAIESLNKLKENFGSHFDRKKMLIEYHIIEAKIELGIAYSNFKTIEGGDE